MVFDSGAIDTNLWSIPMDTNRGRVTGDRQSLTQVEGVRQVLPSLSRDGNKVAFLSTSNLVVKDLVTGHETQLTQASGWAEPKISPDGSSVVGDLWADSGTEADIYTVSTAGGSPRLVCRGCGMPKGFSSDGSRVLTQRGVLANRFDKIALVEFATGKVTDVLSDPKDSLFHGYYSWDDKWMTFKRQIRVDSQHTRLYITPVESFLPAGSDRWIQLTGGEYDDDKPALSPDGNTLYFTSNRDGFTCIWALRLDPKTKRPLGAPFPIQHFHGGQRVHPPYSIDMELNIAKDKIVTNLDELHSDIWMMDLEPQK
jgi:eukaryotic-like serine/threonine-protein kinase